MLVPSLLTAWSLSRWIGGHELGEVLVVVATAVVGATTYLALQRAWRAPEVALLRLGTGALPLRRIR
jgi:hypothetical protein